MRPSAGLVSGAIVLAFAIAAVAFLLPSVAAQAPPSASPSVEVVAEVSQGSVSLDEPKTFTVTVRNTSPAVPGLEGNMMADVAVSVTGAPEGWSVAIQPATFELPPGGEEQVDITVSITPEVGTGSTTLTVTADLYSPLEGLEPILGSVPGASQKATASTPLEVSVDNSLTRDVMEAIGPWVYALLLLLVAAVLVIVGISVASRRTLVRLAADTRELPVAPGGKVAFPFRVEGLARETDAVLLQVSAVQDGWAAFLPVPELDLEPGQVQEVSLVVIAPRDAAQGMKQAVLVTATSAKAPKGAASVEFLAVVEGVEPLPAAPRRSKSA